MDWRDPLAGIQTVERIEQASHQFGGTFCADCEPLLRASMQVQARQLWQDWVLNKPLKLLVIVYTFAY